MDSGFMFYIPDSDEWLIKGLVFSLFFNCALIVLLSVDHFVFRSNLRETNGATSANEPLPFHMPMESSGGVHIIL